MFLSPALSICSTYARIHQEQHHNLLMFSFARKTDVTVPVFFTEVHTQIIGCNLCFIAYGDRPLLAEIPLSIQTSE